MTVSFQQIDLQLIKMHRQQTEMPVAVLKNFQIGIFLSTLSSNPQIQPWSKYIRQWTISGTAITQCYLASSLFPPPQQSQCCWAVKMRLVIIGEFKCDFRSQTTLTMGMGGGGVKEGREQWQVHTMSVQKHGFLEVI